MSSATTTVPVVTVGTGPLTFDEVVAVARDDARVDLAEESLGRGATDAGASSRRWPTTPSPHYGVSTGFGALATRHIPVELRAQLQRSLVRSHAAGSGPEVEREVVRALMLLRISTLATGRTGIREETLRDLRRHAQRRHHAGRPRVRLARLLRRPRPAVALRAGAHGRGRRPRRRRRAARPRPQALAAAGIAPVELREKEGLALINGTDGMLGMLVLAITDLRRLLTVADITAAMSVEALLGTDDVFAADLHALRPQPGQAVSAANLRRLLQDSGIRESHRDPEACTRVQDAYSLRCAPQVAGGARDTVDHAARVAGWELASAVDNPVVTPDGRVESNGNFHGAPVAYVLDFLAIVAADLASISERRTDRFLDVSRNHGLNAVPRRRPGRRQRPHDRPVHPGRHRLGDEAAGRPRLGRLDPVAAPCRRTTCRWAGRRPASCAARSTASPGCSPSSCSPRPAPSTCGHP